RLTQIMRIDRFRQVAGYTVFSALDSVSSSSIAGEHYQVRVIYFGMTFELHCEQEPVLSVYAIGEYDEGHRPAGIDAAFQKCDGHFAGVRFHRVHVPALKQLSEFFTFIGVVADDQHLQSDQAIEARCDGFGFFFLGNAEGNGKGKQAAATTSSCALQLAAHGFDEAACDRKAEAGNVS